MTDSSGAAAASGATAATETVGTTATRESADFDAPSPPARSWPIASRAPKAMEDSIGGGELSARLRKEAAFFLSTFTPDQGWMPWQVTLQSVEHGWAKLAAWMKLV